MSAPSPFMTALGIGQNLAPSITRASDVSNINDILNKASAQGEEGIDNAIQQIITNVSPQNQKEALNILQNKKKQFIETQRQGAYEGLADELLKTNPENTHYQSLSQILKSKLPHDEKAKLMKTISENFPYKEKQQKRLDLDQKLKFYGTKIKEIDEELKKIWNKDSPEYQDLLGKKREYQAQRDLLVDFTDEINGMEEQVEETETITTPKGKLKARTGFVLMLDPQGNVREVSKSDRNRAKKEANYKDFR